MANSAETRALQRLQTREWIQPNPQSKVRVTNAEFIDEERYPFHMGFFIHVLEREDGIAPGLYFSPLGIPEPAWREDEMADFREATIQYVNRVLQDPAERTLTGLSGNTASHFGLEVAMPYDPEIPDSVLLRVVQEVPVDGGRRIVGKPNDPLRWINN